MKRVASFIPLSLLFSLGLIAQTPAAPPPTLASLADGIKAAQMSGDNAWMLVSCALVLMMTGPGLALFYSGLVRKKNVLGTMMQSFIMMAVATVLWAVVGYSFSFAEGSPFLGDLRYMFLNGVGLEPNSDYGATVPHQTYMMFQLMFAIITPINAPWPSDVTWPRTFSI